MKKKRKVKPKEWCGWALLDKEKIPYAFLTDEEIEELSEKNGIELSRYVSEMRKDKNIIRVKMVTL